MITIIRTDVRTKRIGNMSNVYLKCKDTDTGRRFNCVFIVTKELLADKNFDFAVYKQKIAEDALSALLKD